MLVEAEESEYLRIFYTYVLALFHMGMGTICVDFRFYLFIYFFDSKFKSVFISPYCLFVSGFVSSVFLICACVRLCCSISRMCVCVCVCVNERLILQCVHASSPSRLICISASHHVA